MKTVDWGGPPQKWFGLLGKYKYVLIVIAAGLALLLIPFGGGGSGAKSAASASAPAEESYSVEELEGRIEQALSQIEGAGQVRLVLTVKGGTRRILAQDEDMKYGKTGADEEQDTELSRKVTTVILSQGSGTESAVVTGSVYPEFQGALVVCSGGGNPDVRLRITEAISVLTGLGSDKISVSPMAG